MATTDEAAIADHVDTEEEPYTGDGLGTIDLAHVLGEPGDLEIAVTRPVGHDGRVTFEMIGVKADLRLALLANLAPDDAVELGRDLLAAADCAQEENNVE